MSAAAQARSVTEIVRLLGLNNSGGQRASIRRRLDRLNIDTSHFTTVVREKYSADLLREAVAASRSVNEVLDHLGIPRRGGSHAHISRRIKAAEIDTSHFLAAAPVETPRFERGTLLDAADGAKSMSEIMRRLGLPLRSSTRDQLRRQLRDAGITEPVAHKWVRLEEADVRRAVALSSTVADVVRILGLPVGEADRRRVLRAIGRYGIDTRHFSRVLTSAQLGRRPRDPAAILVVRPYGTGRTSGATLRRALMGLGERAECAGCGIGPCWQGKPLTLEVDHISGDPLDNRRQNLRLLCPNCHSQTITYGGRNRR